MKGDYAVGTITAAKTGSTAPVTISGINTTCQVARDLTVAAGDPVILVKVGSTWYVIGRTFTAAPTAPDDSGNPTPPAPKPTVITGTTTIYPVETRSRQGTKWRTDNDDVYQGEWGNGNHTGCVFYGTKPGSLEGSTITDAKIKVRRPDRGGMNAAQPTTLRLMTQKLRPGGAPTLTSSTSGPSLRRGSTNNAFDIPTSWAQSMVDGTAGGLAFFEADGDPYVILSGRGDWSSAFAMTLKWTRTT